MLKYPDVARNENSKCGWLCVSLLVTHRRGSSRYR